MHVAVLQENLKSALTVVGHAVAGKSPLPVLLNILLKAEGDTLSVSATNLETAITVQVGAKVEMAGAITLPAKLLASIVDSLPNDRVTLTLDERTQTVKLECARFTNNIKGITADEFPIVPTVPDTAPALSLPSDVLRQAIDQVAFAAASNESRPVLTGVLLRLDDRQAVLAAADGYRLARKVLPLSEAHDPVDMIIPATALGTWAQIAGKDDCETTIRWTEGGVEFTHENTTLYTRLIDGSFPDFERIIPQEYTTRTLLDTQALIKAVKLSSYFALASQGIVKIAVAPGEDDEPGTFTISANAPEVGDNIGVIDALVHGNKKGEIAVNVKFLSEALKAMKVAQVAFEQQTAQNPGVFRPVGQDDYVHIVMPMTVR